VSGGRPCIYKWTFFAAVLTFNAQAQEVTCKEDGSQA
jgi:hypothetical protein